MRALRNWIIYFHEKLFETMLQNFQYNNGIKANKILPRIFSSFGAV